MSDNKSKAGLAEDLAYHSTLEQLPNGDLVSELRYKIGDEKFASVANDLWEIALETLYFNVSSEVRNTLNQYVETNNYDELVTYLVQKTVEEPMYLDLLGKGLKLAVDVVTTENNF